MKKFFEEFKKFISRGNVIDLAVGVIIGGAFTAIVTALTDGILKPFINWLISLITGGEGVEAIYTFLKPVYDDAGILDMTKSIFIDWGALLSAIINFLLVALILFLIIKGINKTKEFSNMNNNIEKVIAYKLKHGKNLNKTEAKYLEKKEQLAREKAEAEKKAEEEANKLTRTEEILVEIKNLLEKK